MKKYGFVDDASSAVSFEPECVTTETVNCYNRIFRTKREFDFTVDGIDYNLVFQFAETSFTPEFSFAIRVDKDRLFNIYMDKNLLGHLMARKGIAFDIADVPAAVGNALLEVALEKFMNAVDAHFKTVSSVVSYTIENVRMRDSDGVHLMFRVTHSNDRHIFHGAISAPQTSMDWLIAEMDTLPPARELACFSLPLFPTVTLGQTTLTLTELHSLERFDLILADHSIEDEQWDVGICFSPSLCFKGKMDPAGKILITGYRTPPFKDDNMNENNDLSDKYERLLEKLPVKIVFELGESRITLSELQQFQAGYIFETERSTASPVIVKANGKPIGSGEIMKIGNRIGVRLLELDTDN